MNKNDREQFNSLFTEEKYNNLLKHIATEFSHTPPFRIAEAPVFLLNSLKSQILEASEIVIDFLHSEEFEKTKIFSTPQELKKCKNIGAPNFLLIDFAITKDGQNNLKPQLIELQSVLPLLGFIELFSQKFKLFYPEFSNFTSLFSSLKPETYLGLLKNTFQGSFKNENIIFLEITPALQQNKIDYLFLEKHLGIQTLCVSEIIVEGDYLFYQKDGRKIPIYKIINRVILEELYNNKKLSYDFSFEKDYNVSWMNHPIWFFNISKYIMPHIKGNYFPKCYYLQEVDLDSIDISNYVLKPIFSFLGNGVELNPTRQQIEQIEDKENYILQEKVVYHPCIQTTDTAIKTEIRIIYFWQNDKEKPIPITTFSRFTKGNRIALKYNKNDSWVGASTCFFRSEDLS